jgi:hypothetical protein
MYTLQALNHWLYQMVEEPVTLMPFLKPTYCPPGTSHLSRHNRASIMEAVPNGCKAIMIHYQHEYEKDGTIQKVSHYKTWVQSINQCYICSNEIHGEFMPAIHRKSLVWLILTFSTSPSKTTIQIAIDSNLDTRIYS